MGLEKVRRGGRGNPDQILLDRHLVSGGEYKTRDGGGGEMRWGYLLVGEGECILKWRDIDSPNS